MFRTICKKGVFVVYKSMSIDKNREEIKENFRPQRIISVSFL